MKAKIKVTRVKQSRLASVDFDNIPFGQTFSDHMFLADFKKGKWGNFQIRPFGKLPMHPANLAIHYGQSIFEGMKASKMFDGTPALMSPEKHCHRLNSSAQRMCMPAFPEDVFVEALEMLLDLDKGWIPSKEGSALYIRPVMYAMDEALGVRASDTYRLLIMTGPVGPYYAKPVRLWVEETYVRAVEGGVGEAKTAGNYAASLLPATQALKNGYDQVMWMDANEHRFIQEVGTMNLFFVIDGVVITPATDGAILKGITREAFMQILKSKNIPFEARPISIDELVAAYDKGLLNEAFGSGTAAVVSHVKDITFREKVMTLPPADKRPIGSMLKKEIDGLRSGKIKDTFGWIRPVPSFDFDALEAKKTKTKVDKMVWA
jgi:branched-chain amino acid aminotransferase